MIDRKTESGIEQVATVWEPASGRTIEVLSDQPGLQVYSGNFFDGKSIGKYGKPQRYRESLALETQKFPDSPNHEQFPLDGTAPRGDLYAGLHLQVRREITRRIALAAEGTRWWPSAVFPGHGCRPQP